MACGDCVSVRKFEPRSTALQAGTHVIVALAQCHWLPESPGPPWIAEFCQTAVCHFRAEQGKPSARRSNSILALVGDAVPGDRAADISNDLARVDRQVVRAAPYHLHPHHLPARSSVLRGKVVEGRLSRGSLLRKSYL